MMPTTVKVLTPTTRRWLLVDAKDQVLGRMASRIALLLRGKHKPIYTPYLDTGDFVLVINAKQVKVTGRNKPLQKVYRRYSGYPDGLREATLEEMLHKHPERVILQAVKGMMPDGPLGRRMLGKLKIYPGSTHPHQAQVPEPVSLGRHGSR